MGGHGFGGFRAGIGFGGGRTFGLEAFEVSKCAVVGALEGGEATLNHVEPAGSSAPGDGGVPFRLVVRFFVALEILDLIVPDERLDAAHAAEEPIGIYKRVDSGLFARADRSARRGVVTGQVVEGRGVFADDECGFGVGAGFQGIEGGYGFARDGGGSSGFLRITAIRFDLSLGCHAGFEIARRQTGSGRAAL